MESVDISKDISLEKSKKVILQMFEDRRYRVCELDEAADNFPQKTCVYLFGPVNNPKRVQAIWVQESKFNNDVIQLYYTHIRNLDLDRLVLILDHNITSHATNAIKELKVLGKIIEIFTLRETQFNWTRHHLVPKHTIVKKVEKAQVYTFIINHMVNNNSDEKDKSDAIKERNEASDGSREASKKDAFEKLPKILTSDKQVRYLGAKRGDIIKIMRVARSAEGYECYYRIVN